MFLEQNSDIMDKIIEARVRFINLSFEDPGFVHNIAKDLYDKGLRKGDVLFGIAVPIW